MAAGDNALLPPHIFREREEVRVSPHEVTEVPWLQHQTCCGCAPFIHHLHLPGRTMPTTPLYCNWCRERIGSYRDAGAVGGAFALEGEAPRKLADHIRTGNVAEVDHGVIAAYACPHCGRNNLLQLPRDAVQE